MKVLFCREKWADSDPNKGESDGNFMISTLESSGMGESMVYYYDSGEFYLKYSDALPTVAGNPFMPDEDIIHYVDMWRPDIVMFSCLISLGDRNIKRKTYAAIRDTGVRVVGIWHEGAAPDVVRWADNYADCVDLNLFIDGECYERWTKRPEKCLGLYDPRDPSEFSLGTADRTIPISFAGTILRRPVRCAGIFQLLASGVPVTKAGGRNEGFAPIEDYVKILQLSMISLNFADAGPYTHYKGRVAEVTLAGAMLMESENEETPKILEPYADYVPFDVNRQQEFVDKVVHYLTHPNERKRIAESGHEKAMERLTGREFWAALFSRLGVDPQCLSKSA